MYKTIVRKTKCNCFSQPMRIRADQFIIDVPLYKRLDARDFAQVIPEFVEIETRRFRYNGETLGEWKYEVFEEE